MKLTTQEKQLIDLAIETHLNSLTVEDRDKYDSEYKKISDKLWVK